MATPYSDPNLYFRLKPVEPTNWDLAFKALQYKQGQYDTNQLKIDSYIQQITNTDIIKPEAKQHLYENVQGIINEVNASGGSDLSDPNIASRIMANIGQALDAPTVNAIKVSREFRAQQSMKQELLSGKNKDLYSNVNWEDMLRRKGEDGKSFSDWVSDGDATSIYKGSLTYEPFSDPDKKMDDFVMDFIKEKGDLEIEIPVEGSGGMRVEKRKISGLSKPDLRRVFSYALSDADKNQLAINARAKNKWYETEEDVARLQGNINAYYGKDLRNIESTIKQLEVKRDNLETSSEKYEEIDNKITEWQQLKRGKETKLNGLETALTERQFDVASSNLSIDQFIDNKVEAYSTLYSDTRLGYGINEGELKYKKFELQVLKQQQEEIKIQQERAAKQRDKDPYTGVINTKEDTDAPNLPEKEETINNNLKEQRVALSTSSKRVISNWQDLIVSTDTTEDIKKEAKRLDLQYRNSLTNKAEQQGEKVTDSQTTLSLADKYDPNGTDLYDIIKTNGGLSLKTAVNSNGENVMQPFVTKVNPFILNRGFKDDLEKRSKQSLIENESAESVNAISENPDTYLFVWDEEKQVANRVNARELLKNDVLDAEGNTIEGEKLSNSKYAKDIERSFLASKTLDKLASEKRDQGLLRVLTSPLTMNPATAARGLQKIFSDKAAFQGIDEYNRLKETFGGDEEKTLKYIEQITPTGRDGFYSSNSLAANDQFSQTYYLNKDYKDTDTWKDGIDKMYGNLESNKAVIIPITNPLLDKDTGRLRSLIGDKYSLEGNNKASSRVKITQTPEGEFKITRAIMNEGGTTKSEEPIDLGTYTATDLRGAIPEIDGMLDLESKKSEYGLYKVGDTIKSSSMEFWSETTPDINKEIIAVRNMQDVNKLTKDSSIAYLTDRNLEYGSPVYADAYLGIITSGFDEQLNKRLPAVIDNVGRYGINGKLQTSAARGEYIELSLYDKKNEKTVWVSGYNNSLPIKSVEELAFKLENTPQTVYTDIVGEILLENYRKNINSATTRETGEATFTSAYKEVVLLPTNTQQQ